MRILVVGGGGREHALTWALGRSPAVRQLWCLPGNAGIAADGVACVAAGADLIETAVAFATREDVDLVVVGPEAPLCAGLADRLRAAGKRVFGPSAAAAEIEGSKAFAKQLMQGHNVPTAAFGAFADLAAAERFIDGRAPAAPLVVKADGLAAGKGVTLCADAREARAAVRHLFDGAAGARVVVEEFLVGREASLLALVDGERVTLLPAAEDHKTVFDGDRGPMTGGMGTVSPTPLLGAAELARARTEIFVPVAQALVSAGRPFQGVLFAGLIWTAAGPCVLEFNCRFGDPETQVIVPRLGDDLALVLDACARGAQPEALTVEARAAVCVVLTAAGYPGPYAQGADISGLDAARATGALVFHAGTRQQGERLVTAGGRVLGVVGRGDDLGAARAAAYAAVDHIHFAGVHFRRDIGARPTETSHG